MSKLIEIPLIIFQLINLYYLFYNLKLVWGPEVYIDHLKDCIAPLNHNNIYV